MKPLHFLGLLTAAFLFSQFMAVKLAFAEDVTPVTCHTNDSVREIITKQVPTAQFVDLTPEQTKLMLSALLAKDPSFDVNSADAIMIGKSPEKHTVLIILFKDGCSTVFTYMPDSEFYAVMASV